MLLVGASLVLLQRRFNLTGYFHQSGSVAAAVANAFGGHRQDSSSKRGEQLARDLHESWNTTLLSSETSKRRIRGRSPSQDAGAKRRRAKGTANGESRNASGDRPEEGTSRDTGETNPVFDADRELKALQNVFAERRQRTGKKRRSTKKSSSKAATSSKVVSAGRTRSKVPGGGIQKHRTSRSALATTSSTSVQPKLDQMTNGNSAPADTTVSGTASRSQVTRSGSRGIRMVRKMRKLRIRFTIPSSTSNSTILSSAASPRGVSVKLYQNGTEETSSEKVMVTGPSTASLVPPHKANSSNSSTEARKTAFMTRVVNKITETNGAVNFIEAALSETSEHRKKSVSDETKSEKKNGTGKLKKPDTSATTRSPSQPNTSHATPGSGQTTSKRKTAVPVNNTSVPATQRSTSKVPRNSSTSPRSSPSPNTPTKNAQTSPSPTTGAKLVNVKTGSRQATTYSGGLSPFPFTKRVINATFPSPPIPSMSNESGSVGNITEYFSLNPSETSADSNRSKDSVLEGHIKTVDEIIRKILEKTGNDTGRFGFGNSTRGSDGSDIIHTTSGDANKHGTLPNERNKGSGTTRMEKSIKTTRVSSSQKLPRSSGSQVTMGGKHSVPHSTNKTYAKKYGATSRPDRRVPKLASETERNISTPTTTSRPPATREEFVPEAKPTKQQSSTTGPPDEIVPEAEVTPAPPNTETTELETTTTSTSFAYYTGKDEWIPESGARRLIGKGGHAPRKVLPKTEAALSQDLQSMDQAPLPHNPERPLQRHEDAQAPQLRGPEQPGSEIRKDEEPRGEGPTALKADVNSELNILYSSLKDALEEEKKHRPKENSEELQDYDNEEHASANNSSRSGEEFAVPGNPNIPVESNLLVSEVTVHSAETSLQSDGRYPQEHNLANDSTASKEVTFRFSGIEQGSNAYRPPSSTIESSVPLGGRESSTDKASYRPGPDAENHLPLAAAGSTGLEKDSSRSRYDYIPRNSTEKSSSHMNYATGDVSRELASTQSMVERLTGPTGSNEAVVQIKDESSTFLNATTAVKESPSATQGSDSDDAVRWSALKDKGSQSTSTEASRASTVMPVEAEKASSLLDNGNEKGTGSVPWISSEKPHQTAADANPGQFEEFQTTRMAARFEGDHNESVIVTHGEVPVRRRPGVVCVYNSSHSGWRSEGVLYSIASIPYEYCSSVLYCCLSLDKELDFEGFGNHSDFRYLANMKKVNPGMQTFVVIGGSGSPTASFRHLVSSSIHQDVLIQLAVHWIKTREFDGAYMYWPQMEDQDGNDATSAYRYLAKSFNKLGIKLGVMLPSSSPYFAKEASLEALTKELDGSFEAVLLPPPEIEELSHGAELAYHTKGLTRAFGRYPTRLPGSVPVCPMIPFWGRTFKMDAVMQESGLALKPAGYGAPRAVTQEPGKVALFEYCRDVNYSASVFSTQEQVLIGNEYMALLTPATLERYLESMVQNKSWRCFGSWGPEWDDFAGHCGSARYPLLRTLYEFQVNHSIKRTAAIGASDAGVS